MLYTGNRIVGSNPTLSVACARSARNPRLRRDGSAPSARSVRARPRHAPCWGSDSSRLLHGPAVRVRRLENSPSRGCLVRARAVAQWRAGGGTIGKKLGLVWKVAQMKRG